jgi:hypothetical protein
MYVCSILYCRVFAVCRHERAADIHVHRHRVCARSVRVCRHTQRRASPTRISRRTCPHLQPARASMLNSDGHCIIANKKSSSKPLNTSLALKRVSIIRSFFSFKFQYNKRMAKFNEKRSESTSSKSSAMPLPPDADLVKSMGPRYGFSRPVGNGKFRCVNPIINLLWHPVLMPLNVPNWLINSVTYMSTGGKVRRRRRVIKRLMAPVGCRAVLKDTFKPRCGRSAVVQT